MKILIVEDNAFLAERISKWLERADYAVDIAKNAEEADFFVGTSLYEGIVLDIGLPDKNGLSLLREWRKSGRDDAIEGVTGFACYLRRHKTQRPSQRGSNWADCHRFSC